MPLNVAEKSPQARWWVYIIECDDASLYTGITTDLSRRWKAHAGGTGAKYFRGRRPVRLVYQEACDNRSLASQREYRIKRMSKAAKQALIAVAGNDRGH